MKNQIFGTNESHALAALRIVLGVVVFSHGAQAMLGWFGGYGFKATMEYLTTARSLPWLVGLSVICVQFFGALMLLTGTATRIAALAIAVMFIGMATYHVEFGFHMNWSGTKGGEGFEYHVLVLVMCLALLISGGGSFSFDRRIAEAKS